MNSFIQKNKVVIAAFISAIILCLQQFVAKTTDLKVIGFAVLVAVLGVAANQWKGKGITLLGIIGNLAGVFINIKQTGTFTWNEFILASLLALLTTFVSALNPQPTANELADKNKV